MNREAQDILASIESGIDIRQNIRSLDFGQWKLIEIARALSYNPKVLRRVVVVCRDGVDRCHWDEMLRLREIHGSGVLAVDRKSVV